VVVDGGPTGVEISGQLANPFRRTMKRDFRRINPRAPRVILLEAGERVAATFSRPTSANVARQLAELGVTVREHAMVTNIDKRRVTVTVGQKPERIATRTAVDRGRARGTDRRGDRARRRRRNRPGWWREGQPPT